MTPLWTAAEAARATGGKVQGDWQAGGVTIDSRRLTSGDLFVALKDRRDGHDFVAAALAGGAAAAVVDHVPHDVAPDAPLLIVDDVLAALERLGAAARARASAKVVAVTGSAGKTSTKEMLRLMLAGQGRVHAAEASYNNHWGVPLTLARLPRDSAFAVVEIGMNHPGEIAPLARLARPDVALITTVAPAHLAAFSGIKAIAREKAAILDGLAPGAPALLPTGLEVSALLVELARKAGARPVTFGATPDADWQLAELRPGDGMAVVRASHPGGQLLFRLASPGRHFALNALGALAAVVELGGDPALAAQDLGHWAPPAGRGARERIVVDPVEETFFDLIDDAFNANPASLAAGLDVLIAARPTDGIGRIGPGRRIAILGDMLELGPREIALHEEVARHPGLAAIDTIHCVGPRMRALHAALPVTQRGLWVETAAELAPRARRLVDAGDIVLVKGSKGSRVSLIAEALRAPAPGMPPEEGSA